MREEKTTRNYWLLLLLGLTILVSACSEDSTTVSYNDYCYVKSVTLGTIKRKMERRDRLGKLVNTTYTSVTGSNFLMTIDQRARTIENRDSLPLGCDLSAVTAAIAFDGSILKYRTSGSNSGWTAYNSTDSLNLTSPLELELTSNDGKSTRNYTLKVNVHKQEADSIYWKQCESEVPQRSGMNDMKAFVMNDKLTVLASNGTKVILAERSGTDAEGTWQEEDTDLPLTADLQTLRQQADKLYLSTSDGSILSSTDAKAWTQEGTTYTTELKLIEKTEQFFYAISVTTDENGTTSKLLRSTDAATWEEDELDSQATLLPTYGIRALTMQQANGNKRIVMVGQRDSKGEGEEYKNAIVWNKMWNESEMEEEAQWMYFPLSDDNIVPCPRLQYLNLLPYDGKCIALGGASTDGKHKALHAAYVSQDYGITWRTDSEIHLPIQLEGTDGCITSTVDKNNFIWIITNAQVWRGRLNRLGFAQQ